VKRQKLVLLLVGTALALALLAWALVPRPVPVETALAVRAPFEQTVDEQARTRIRDHYLVSSPLGGELDRIMLREGDEVAAGAVVARLHPVLPALLDSRTELELRGRVEAARAAKERADARVAQAQVGVAQAKLDVERTRKLAESKLIAIAKLEADELAFQMSTRELETARADAHVASHDIDIAVAALTRAREAGHGQGGSDWLLRAPIAGRVLRVHQKSSGTVAAGTPLIEVGDPANLEVVIQLLTTEAPQVTPGAYVRLDNWGIPRALSGRIRCIEPWGFTKVSALGVEEQRVNVVVDIATPYPQWSGLGEGYRLDAHIRVYERNDALTVPTGALFRSGAQWQVYTVPSTGRAHRTAITIGRRTEVSTEVLAGLKEGEEVVVYPSDAVVDQTRVTVAKDPKVNRR
jgi:HlyD family secretion protein